MVQTAPVAGFANTGLALLAGLAGLVPLAPVDALAQGFPTRPVRIIDAFPAGGAGDVIARILSPRLGEALGQTVIVENRPGAGGNIGAEVAAKAPADGHTMFMGVSVVLAPSRSLYANLPYDALRDFMPVSRVGTGAYLLASHPSLPVKTVKDVVALARAKPGALNYASGGIGSGQHLAGELFKSRTGSALTHVAYKGGPPAVAAVAAGESEIGFVTVTAGLGQVNAGRLRALGVSSPQRLPTMPNVPTIAESGYPGFEVTPIFGLYVPTGTPKEVIATLNAAVRKTVDNAEVRDRLAAQAVVAGSSTPEELGRSLAEEIAQWAKVIKAAGIKIE
ncbi:MAG: tripartite tricarboxylate transporter substrate binding protein [Rhodocyclaceae bacterium]|nr:tripartite tricarboxylate transporter substrate binding protein [Rhodocyclaceae bacterium]MCA3075150.1 tripartite tricarboxylate transporter substrate binding protein [Rhodocyclaceae bacterium]MCA3089876.1 tripartite tricarboxylate transporter substrate binding protein [Rhodocyclaceae bacterium]MCA3093524.1 tripartite tricarboxylate transporter substrate binding protein [Rhodocyclaceae bacterium]MCA3096341.1 tripartite tricarboxylate transporter substrate binding protein [Rhodocyclaceae bact